MSVLIKGMEMPIDGCSNCIFVNRKWHGDFCPFLKREVTGNVERGGFQTDCPLISVPPHGRLIDADAAYEQFLNLMDTQGAINPCQLGTILVDAPTIIPAEESE